MEKKTIYYIIGGVAVLGIGYYFWNKSKSDKSKETGETTPVSSESSNEESVTKEKEVNTSKEDGVAVKPSFKPLNVKVDGIKNIATSVAKLKPISSQELESKLQTACGKKPLLKKNKVKYEQCRENYKNKLKSEGFSFFAGKTESVIAEDFYSSFESNLDLDI